MYFSKCIFPKCISQNVFFKMYFSKSISQNVGVVFSVTNPPLCNSSPPLPSKSTQFRFGWRLFGCFNVNSKDTFLIMGEYKHCFVKEKILNLEGNGPLKRGLKRDLNGSLKVSHLCIFFQIPCFQIFCIETVLMIGCAVGWLQMVQVWPPNMGGWIFGLLYIWWHLVIEPGPKLD